MKEEKESLVLQSLVLVRKRQHACCTFLQVAEQSCKVQIMNTA